MYANLDVPHHLYMKHTHMILHLLICRKGHVCMIPGSKEFFIAAVDHKEWGTAHTVWGVVSAPFSLYVHLLRSVHLVDC